MKRRIGALAALVLAVLTVAPVHAQAQANVQSYEQFKSVLVDGDAPVSPAVDAVLKEIRAARAASGETFRSSGVDYYGYLRNANGRCLDVESSGGVFGTRIVHFDCHYGDNQIFKLTKDPNWNQWEIKPALASTQCVDVYNNVGPDLFRHPCHLGTNQLWATDTSGLWVSYLNNHVLDASGTDLRALNWPYTGAPNQDWTLYVLT